MTFLTFGCWYGVQCAIDEKVSLYYQAPLDSAPRPVFILKQFKNGKIRLTSGEVTFTAGATHLDRFRWIDKSA